MGYDNVTSGKNVIQLPSRIRTERVPSWSCSQAVSKLVWHIPLLRVQWKTPGDGQRNCPKHAEFYSQNKFKKLVYLVGFIIRTLNNNSGSACLWMEPVAACFKIPLRYLVNCFQAWHLTTSLTPHDAGDEWRSITYRWNDTAWGKHTWVQKLSRHCICHKSRMVPPET